MDKWWIPELTGDESGLIGEVLDQNYLNEGPKTKQLEFEFQTILDVKHAIMVPSGTQALYLALKALNIGVGDEVLVPDVTFIATANAVSMTGAMPVLCDVTVPSTKIDITDAQSKITSKTKAIIPVHVSGRNSLDDSVKALAQDNKLFIVEDAAEALMSKSQKQFLGTLGDAGIYSLSPNKLITTGQGGVMVTNDDEIAHNARLFKNQGRDRIGSGFRETHLTIGTNLRFTDLQAAVGLCQLQQATSRANHQKELALLYNELLNTASGIMVCGFDTNAGEIPLWYDILVDNPENFSSYMMEKGFPIRPYWHALSHQSPYKGPINKGANTMAAHGVWLPSAFQLSTEKIVKAAKVVIDYGRLYPLELER